jgi:hypothetical protein
MGKPKVVRENIRFVVGSPDVNDSKPGDHALARVAHREA